MNTLNSAEIPAEIPDRIALLSIGAAQRHLSHGVLTGQEHPPAIALGRAVTALVDPSTRWDTTPVRELLDEAMARFASRRAEADAWLAPRLHATLRMTRREAADKDMWAFLAMLVAPDYVCWRHRPQQREDDAPQAARAVRFVGPNNIQTFARLWWAAEMFRDGGNYRSAEIACGSQDMFHTALRLDIIDHRPTAIALARILDQLVTIDAADLTSRVNALCRAVNAAGSTLMYEVIAPDAGPDETALLSWIDKADAESAVGWDRLPDGPDDGEVPPRSVDTLVNLFREFLAEAEIRERSSRTQRDRQVSLGG
jgi:hypothetical protein